MRRSASYPAAFASLTILLLLLGSHPASAALFRLRSRGQQHSSLTLRQRMHVNPLIADIGTLEIEWNHQYSTLVGDYSMPSTIKYTPEGSSLLWGRTEYSVNFDSLEAFTDSGNRPVHFSDRLTFNATTVVVDGEHFDFAVIPQFTTFLRGESGIRAGAAAIGRFDFGRNNLGITSSWNGATSASPTNPAGTFDAGIGYGRRLASGGLLSKFTPHANFVYERSTGVERIRAAFEGIECQITDKVSIDVSGQHFSVPGGGAVDNQILVGLTVNFGRLHR